MNKSVLVAGGAAIAGALIVLVLVYFNFIAPPGGPPSPCPGGDPHCIVVNVITVQGQPQIDAIPAHYVHDPGVVISWMIGPEGYSEGYSFPADGIAFNKPSNPPTTSTEFVNCHTAGAKKFVCTDKHNSVGAFGYSVKLDAAPGVGPVATLDPFIINR